MITLKKNIKRTIYTKRYFLILCVNIKPDTPINIYTCVLPKYSKIQVLPGITSCRLMKYNKQAIELNSLLINDMPKDGYEWS